ncbi:MAG: helix-turn-helix domain-containing protein [Clostridia bacterium]|nr:helix-turn-helix domain-containing protein [Clostridia bacterium]
MKIIIGQRIKKRREELGWTQEDLGNALSMNKSTIQRYESGSIGIKQPVLLAIAKALDISPDWLLNKTAMKDNFFNFENNENNCEHTTNISIIRKNKNITMAEAARILKLPYTTYVGYEKGEREPNIAILIRMADVFQVSVDYLIGRTSDSANNFSNIEESRPTKCVKVTTIQERLIQEMTSKQLRQIDIINMAQPFCEKYGGKLTKTDLTQYISGKTEPNQIKLLILSATLNVNEVWLMGYDVASGKESYYEKNGNTYKLISLFEQLTEEQQQLIILQLQGIVGDLS